MTPYDLPQSCKKVTEKISFFIDFVIPLDFAIDFMTDNGMDRTTAGSVMSALGIAELISRVVCAVTGEQKYVS